MKNAIKLIFYSKTTLCNYNRIFIPIMLSVFIASCNGQNKTKQETLSEIKVSTTEPTKHAEEIVSEIEIDSTRQSKLDFSLIDVHFDKV